MLDQALTTLEQALHPYLPLSKDRREMLALLVVGMVSARTVNLSHIASERPGTALVASTYRRLQRFFQHVELGADWSAPVAAKLLGLQGSWTLALDRTQWRVGERDVNFLVLAAVTPRFRVPLMWSVIEGRGCSDTEQRIALMRRYLALFDVSTIRLLLADREFVGTKWLNFLTESGIPFAIRLREDMRVVSEEGHDLPLAAHLGSRGRTRFLRGRFAGMAADAPPLDFALKRLAGELLIVVTNRPAAIGLAAYAKRWAIESFGPLARTGGARGLTWRPQDARPQHGGHPPHRPAQARLAHGPRRARHRLDRPRRHHPNLASQAPDGEPRLSRQVLVPHRLRCHPPAPQNRPARRCPRLDQDHGKTPDKAESRVVCAHMHVRTFSQ